MKSTKPVSRARLSRPEPASPWSPSFVEQTSSLPSVGPARSPRSPHASRRSGNSPHDPYSASDTNLTVRENEPGLDLCGRVGQASSAQGDASYARDMRQQSPSPARDRRAKTLAQPHAPPDPDRQRRYSQEKTAKCCRVYPAKKSRSCSPTELEDPLARQLRDIHNDTRKSARIIKDSRSRLLELQKKQKITDADVKELGDRHELLLREMERFDRLTRTLQKLAGSEVVHWKKPAEEPARGPDYVPGSAYEPAMHHEMKMNHPTVLLAAGLTRCDVRCRSEIDLTRKLNESYDMQEKLVADNADLEVKRYILYKELMTKDQSLETCRAQVKRLQGELKLLERENAALLERAGRTHAEGDATTTCHDYPGRQELDITCEQEKSFNDTSSAQELAEKLESYKSSTVDLENQIGGLELEVRHVRVEMEAIKEAAAATARAGAGPPACRGAGAGPNTCFSQSGGPPVPPLSRACGVCPPCPAPCNPNAPPTPAEREVARLNTQLRQTEENFKTKVTECAILRADLMKKKEELEKERCQHRETQNKLRELEMKFEGLATHTNMMLGTKEQALEVEVNVRALKQCYREAREEIDELRLLNKEQNDQIQDYRVKYMQAQQLVEEQRRQMDLMDMDNTRISEQINLEIQKVKLKFQEKLQELAPIPELLKATQMRLKDAQQAQAVAEHNAEQLARELNCAREKVHLLLHNTTKPVEKQPDRSGDDKQVALLQQRITQLSENNVALKTEIERLKSNVIRLEESVLANEKRLQEKMHECAQLGGELDRTRDEASRALQRANDRMDTVRKCMQTTVAELERQLAASRAQVKSAEKEREELQCRMKCQIKRLNDNFEQAQLRILGLTAQVQSLRRTDSSITDGEGDSQQQECLCKSMFDNP